MKIYKKYKIGNWVKVDATYESRYVDGYKKLVRAELSKPKYGQIVGIVQRFEGRCYYDSYDGPNHFKHKKSIRLIKVAVSWTSKPIEAKEEDMELTKFQENLPYNNPSVWPKKKRDDLRRIMKDWPRDKKGKWQ